jgi:hypothetical protein
VTIDEIGTETTAVVGTELGTSTEAIMTKVEMVGIVTTLTVDGTKANEIITGDAGNDDTGGKTKV